MKSANDLLEELDIFEKLKNTNNYRTVISLDDYIYYEVEQAIETLNKMFADYEFCRQELFGGFAHDLIIIDKQKKAEREKIPKSKTNQDILNYCDENNIHLCGLITEISDEKITDSDYCEMIDEINEMREQARKLALQKKKKEN